MSIHGKDRIEIVESILRHVQLSDSQGVEIELSEFEREFRLAHSPVEKPILVLCDACHRKYDSMPAVSRPLGPGATIC
jgi:hypothetical protein